MSFPPAGRRLQFVVKGEPGRSGFPGPGKAILVVVQGWQGFQRFPTNHSAIGGETRRLVAEGKVPPLLTLPAAFAPRALSLIVAVGSWNQGRCISEISRRRRHRRETERLNAQEALASDEPQQKAPPPDEHGASLGHF